MKALLIHHKGAGDGAADRETLADAIEEAGWKVRGLERKKADAKAIKSARPDLVVVAGGDGTVAHILALLPDRSIPVAIVPTGTANNIALSLGIEGEPEKVIAGWDMDRRRRFDIGNAYGPWGCRPFAEGVGFGAFADSLRRAPDLDGASKLRAGRGALREAVRESAPMPLDLETDGEKLPSGLLLAEIMNVPMAGPRLPLAPDADAGDGRLHIACLAEADREAMCRWLDRKSRADCPVSQVSGQEVAVRGGGVMMRIDDRSCWLEPDTEVTIRLEGEPVQILAPPGSPALAGACGDEA